MMADPDHYPGLFPVPLIFCPLELLTIFYRLSFSFLLSWRMSNYSRAFGRAILLALFGRFF